MRLRFLLPFLASAALLRAELPAPLKPSAEAYDRQMASYDNTWQAQVKIARDGYIAVLGAARKQAEGAKRTAEVAAIDADLQAAQAGPLPKDPPPNLPVQLGIYRVRLVEAPARATKALETVRRSAREQYLKNLDALDGMAARVKDTALAAAVAAERQRVLTQEPKP